METNTTTNNVWICNFLKNNYLEKGYHFTGMRGSKSNSDSTLHSSLESFIQPSSAKSGYFLTNDESAFSNWR